MKKVMRSTFYVITVFVSLFLAGNVSAYTFIDIYLDESGSALFLGGSDEYLSLPGGIKINDGEIIGRTQGLTNKQGEIWSFSYFLENAEINLILPKGAVIKFIEEGEIYINNDKISVQNLGGVSLTYTLDEIPNNLFLWFFTGLICIGVLIGILFYTQRKSKNKNKIERKEELIKGILSERENLILEKLKQMGKIKSSQLRKICDIPKASFSRHVQELERKGLLKKTGDGKNKFLELS